MNRLQFLTELRKSLITTTKEITLPFIGEELEEAKDVADKIVGVKWLKLEGITPSSFIGVQDRFINKSSILFFSDGEQLKAYEKICSSCQSLVQWIAYDKKIKCFTCDKTFDVETETGDLAFKHYYIKEKNGEWFIGVV